MTRLMPHAISVSVWEVLPSDSRFLVIASGINSDPGKAKRDVEIAMMSPGAGIGQLVRLTIPGYRHSRAEASTCTPVAEVQQCRRNRQGGYSWYHPYATDLHGARHAP